MTKPCVNTSSSGSKGTPIDSLFQGSVVDAKGHEIPITERMIQDACEALEKEVDSIYSNEAYTGEIYTDEDDSHEEPSDETHF